MAIEPVRLEGAKVLVVDDTPANVILLTELLEAEGYEVFAATSGEQCLKIASLELPALILLDVMMPGLSGFDTCRHLKSLQTTRDIPVIFVSARSDTGDVVEGFQIGAVDYIGKPIRQEEVCARVKTHLQLRALIVERDGLIDLLRTHNTELRLVSSIDPLTKLANRATFGEALEREWRRLASLPRTLSLVFLDVDFFKRFNDGYGHQAGDSCLQTVALVLKDLAHQPDIVAGRYGGEEFVVLLPASNAEQAQAVAEEIRAKVQAASVEHRFSEAAGVVTVSIGVATCDHAARLRHQESADLVRAADEALYRAKASGRNRVVASVLGLNP